MAKQFVENPSKNKRKRNGKPGKIALCSPYEPFKPLISTAHTKKIHEFLKSLLLREKNKTKLPWKKLIKLSKDVRKERIRELNDKNITSDDLQKQRKCVKFGLNAVARAIEHNDVSCCLFAGDVEPDIILDHLISSAVTRRIPALIVPKMKKITRDVVGFPCLALGIVTHEESHYLQPLVEEISSIFSEFPTPQNFGCILKRKENLEEIRQKLADTNKLKRKLNLVRSIVNKTDETIPTTEIIQNEITSQDFIALKTEPDLSHINVSQPRIDIASIYLCPKFKRVPRNPNKLKVKRKKV